MRQFRARSRGQGLAVSLLVLVPLSGAAHHLDGLEQLLLGLVGGFVVKTGMIDDAEAPERLDVGAIYSRIQTGGWMVRWGG